MRFGFVPPPSPTNTTASASLHFARRLTMHGWYATRYCDEWSCKHHTSTAAAVLLLDVCIITATSSAQLSCHRGEWRCPINCCWHRSLTPAAFFISVSNEAVFMARGRMGLWGGAQSAQTKNQYTNTQGKRKNLARKAVFTLRTTTYDIVRCRTMSCAVWTPLKPRLVIKHSKGNSTISISVSPYSKRIKY